MRKWMTLVESSMARQELEDRWNNPEFLAKYEPLMNRYHCETVAEVVKRLEPNTMIWGFSDEENPGTHYFDGDDEDGHHFAVVGGKFIVDPWMFEPEGRSVFEFGVDDAEIRKLYGDRSKWSQIDTQRGYTFTKDSDFN